MKEKLEDLLEELKERQDYYLKRADDINSKSAIGHYIELKFLAEKLEEILYDKK